MLGVGVDARFEMLDSRFEMLDNAGRAETDKADTRYEGKQKRGLRAFEPVSEIALQLRVLAM
jgi:hypothetical protein